MKIARLSEVSEVLMGQSPPGSSYNKEGKGLPLIGGASDFGATYPCPSKFTTKPTRTCITGDILICVRATIGDLNVADRDYCLGRGVAAIRPYSGAINTRFLWHQLLRSKRELEKQARGSTFKQVSKSVVEGLQISYPSMNEQVRIASVLDKADEISRKREQSIQLCDQLLKSVFLEMFGDPVTNPKGWDCTSIGEVSVLVTSGLTPRGGSKNYVEEGPYFIRSQNVLMNMLDLNDAACLPVNIHESMHRTKVFDGDVLLNITGASLGRVAWVSHLDREANVNQHVCIVRPNHELLDPAYLSVCISQPSFQSAIENAEVGAAREGLSHSRVRRLKIPLPPPTIQRKFGKTVLALRNSRERIETSFIASADLQNSLSHMLMDGRPC